MYKLFMAFRYLRAHKIIYFSIVGVAVGIMTMVVVTSLMGGFSRDMKSRIRGMQTHIIVTSADKVLKRGERIEAMEFEAPGAKVEAGPPAESLPNPLGRSYAAE